MGLPLPDTVRRGKDRRPLYPLGVTDLPQRAAPISSRWGRSTSVGRIARRRDVDPELGRQIAEIEAKL